MKKILLLPFLILAITVSAQNISVDEDTILLDGPAFSTVDITFYTTITNNTSDTLFLKWDRITEDMPGGWFTKICDDELCHAPFVSSSQFTNPLLPNNSTYIIGYVTLDNATSGVGILELAVYDPLDSANTNILLHYEYDSWALGTTSDIDFSKEIILYPVPAKEEININFNSVIEDAIVEIFDITGKLIESNNIGHIKNHTVNVNGFAEGQYFIRITELSSDKVSVKSFIKL